MMQRALCLDVMFVACLLVACQPAPSGGAGSAPETTSAPREAVNALDRATAIRRKARASDVEYALHVDLERNGETFAGEVTIRYQLSDAASDLTLDFEDWTVVSTGAGEQEPAANGRSFWRFETTPEMSTYIFSKAMRPPSGAQAGACAPNASCRLFPLPFDSTVRISFGPHCEGSATAIIDPSGNQSGFDSESDR
jgi:hypothetical protein